MPRHDVDIRNLGVRSLHFIGSVDELPPAEERCVGDVAIINGTNRIYARTRDIEWILIPDFSVEQSVDAPMTISFNPDDLSRINGGMVWGNYDREDGEYFRFTPDAVHVPPSSIHLPDLFISSEDVISNWPEEENSNPEWDTLITSGLEGD